MVERFNEVARRNEFEFDAWFSTRVGAGRSWDVDERGWEFSYRYLPSVGHGEHPLAFPTPLLSGNQPDLLVSLYASTAFLLGSALARTRGARIAYWAEVTFDSWLTRRWWKERVKSFALSRADAILTAGTDGREYVKRYGAAEERIFTVPHVIDAGRYSRGSDLSPAERQRARDDLGVRGVTFIYVGRLWWGKGLRYLLEAFAELQRMTADEVSLLLVGDGPDELEVRDRCRELEIRDVVFAGFRQADELPRVYAAADVFVFPTLGDPYGMVVPEAMACRLPVISTASAGEIRDRLSDGVNGFVVAPADSSTLRDRMAELVRNSDLRQEMGRRAAESVSGQAPAVWAEVFGDVVTHILSMPRNTRR